MGCLQKRCGFLCLVSVTKDWNCEGSPSRCLYHLQCYAEDVLKEDVLEEDVLAEDVLAEDVLKDVP